MFFDAILEKVGPSAVFSPTRVMADFSGKWVCTGREGDWPAFLKAIGEGWATRKLAAASNYGVGLAKSEISMPDGHKTVHIKSKAGRFWKMGVSIETDGSIIETGAGPGTCVWRGETLVVSCVGPPEVVYERSLTTTNGKTVMVVRGECKGVSAATIHEKQAGTPDIAQEEEVVSSSIEEDEDVGEHSYQLHLLGRLQPFGQR